MKDRKPTLRNREAVQPEMVGNGKEGDSLMTGLIVDSS